MDLIEIVSGRYLLELLGASARYVYANMIVLLNENDFISFSEIWSPKGNINKKNGNSERNHMIGTIIFIGIIVVMLIFTP
ncbi:hypothetical protein [Flavobacterium hibisci]|jgi:hypothetical protein|uniref:hypothetical protein n=1 Tax=Flavobacterium hibisci TaxID=1914462 RepID=UPI001CBE118C|nr:hypothetical protein [Flavobacterium hibisci]MBZ4041704.1 hypothetical protein [Flavobacterium hibisci]